MKTKIITGIAAFAMIISMKPQTVQAAKVNYKARYADYIIRHSKVNSGDYASIIGDLQYAFVYIDKDSVPELVFSESYDDTIEVLTLHNGRVSRLAKGNSEVKYVKKGSRFCFDSVPQKTYKIKNGRAKAVSDRSGTDSFSWPTAYRQSVIDTAFEHYIVDRHDKYFYLNMNKCIHFRKKGSSLSVKTINELGYDMKIYLGKWEMDDGITNKTYRLGSKCKWYRVTTAGKSAKHKQKIGGYVVDKNSYKKTSYKAVAKDISSARAGYGNAGLFFVEKNGKVNRIIEVRKRGSNLNKPAKDRNGTYITYRSFLQTFKKNGSILTVQTEKPIEFYSGGRTTGNIITEKRFKLAGNCKWYASYGFPDDATGHHMQIGEYEIDADSLKKTSYKYIASYFKKMGLLSSLLPLS